MYCRDVVITDNVITRTIAGMVPMYSDRVMVVNNTVYLVRGGGIGEGVFIQESDNIIVENNVISGNLVGIYVGRTPNRPGSTAVIKRNLIAFNLVGVKVDTVSEAIFTENSFVENVKDVMLVGYGEPKSFWYDPESRLGNFWSGDPLSRPYISASNLAEELFEQHKELKVLTFSPSYLLLELLVSKSLGEIRAKVVDPYPLTSPSISVSELLRLEENRAPHSIIAPAVTTLLAFNLLVLARRAGSRS
jgi:nitrous oxidase accessory protein